MFCFFNKEKDRNKKRVLYTHVYNKNDLHLYNYSIIIIHFNEKRFQNKVIRLELRIYLYLFITG